MQMQMQMQMQKPPGPKAADPRNFVSRVPSNRIAQKGGQPEIGRSFDHSGGAMSVVKPPHHAMQGLQSGFQPRLVSSAASWVPCPGRPRMSRVWPREVRQHGSQQGAEGMDERRWQASSCIVLPVNDPSPPSLSRACRNLQQAMFSRSGQ
ncbi:hypothetical protein BDZ45DRAFT_686007 [Acephala macrosclerotiorum]|nr:hypothetical protein BDZ45DRAFT_686007 [Acephala macrosclerotiorum]